MLTRRWITVTVAALAFVDTGSGASAAERSLLGVVLGRSYRQVLTKFGSPTRVQLVMIPVPGQQPTGYDPNNPAGAGGAPGYGAPGGAPGYGAPAADVPGGYPGAGGASTGGGAPGGPPGYGAPSGYGPPGGASTGGGPPMLPPVGGAPGGPGYGGGYGGDTNAPGQAGPAGVSNGAEWIYNRPGGVTLAFIINEDGRVAQISVSSGKAYPAARTAKGVGIGADYSRVL